MLSLTVKNMEGKQDYLCKFVFIQKLQCKNTK